MILIIDYGMGNLRSVEKAFAYLGHEALVSDDPALLREAEGIVLPGVGAFGDAMMELHRSGFVSPIIEMVEGGRPLLGICLGYQLLFEASQENPGVKGLALMAGEAIRFPGEVKIPHMGWNDVAIKKNHPILEGVGDGSFFYFVHSYYVSLGNEGDALTMTDYGGEFASGVAKDNLVAFQFHPEKSSKTGLRILNNFAEMCAR
jgi:glutamine amidotransferase